MVSVVDPDAAVRSAARSEGLGVWESLADALAQDAADAAVIASVPAEHEVQTIECLRAGLPVLVEKPAALSYDGALRMEAAARAGDRPVTVIQNFRFLPRERALRRALERGLVGRVLRGIAVSSRPAAVVRPHLAAVEEGPLWDVCLHYIDVLRARFGATPTEVRAQRNRDEVARERSTYIIDLNWNEAMRFSIFHRESAPAYSYAEVLEGERGVLRLTDRTLSVSAGGRFRTRPILRRSDPDRAVLRLFLRSLDTSTEGPLSLSDNLLTIATVEAARRSIELGRPVLVSEVTGLSEAVDQERGR